MSNKIFFSL